MEVPAWALSLAYWLHLIATIAWIGGLAAVSLLSLPLAARMADPVEKLQLLHLTQKRLDPVAWFSLVLLVATGLVQMSASAQYEGFLAFGNAWAQAILLKHIVFLGMVPLSAYLTWRALPELSRAVLRLSKGRGDPAEVDLLYRRHQRLLRANLVLGLVVLVFTAIARVNA